MSRRKQSNPKPLKREDFWNEGDAENAASSQQSPSAADVLSGEEEPEGQNGVKIEVDDDAPKNGDDEEEEEIDVDAGSQPPPKLTLNTNLATDPALRINKEHQQDSSSDRSSPAEDRFKPDINMLPTLFAAGSSPAPAIFCLPAAHDANSTAPAAVIAAPRLSKENLEIPAPPPPPRLANCFMCQPCGIRFSSKSTLEAHQTYYCSHRASVAQPTSPSTPVAGSGKEGSDTEHGSPRSSVAPDDESAPPPAKMARIGRQYTCPHCSYSADKKVSLNRHMRMHTPSVTPVSPAPAGPSDSETADESAAAGAPLPPPALDRYCANCDIRFTSVKTFHAHKKHYCETRHVVKPNQAVSPAAASQASSGPEMSRVSSAASPTSSPAPSQPYMALPTTPMLLVPYQLVQAASFISSAALPPGFTNSNPGTCLLLVNGTVQPLVLPTVAQERVPTPNPPPLPARRQHPVEKHQPQSSATPQLVPEVATNGSPFPLDLSLPRSAQSLAALSTGSTSPRLGAPDPEDEKENRGLNTSSPSQSSSRASSPSATSPRPVRVNGGLPGAPKKPEVAELVSTPVRKHPNLVPHIKLPKQQLLMPEFLAPLLGSQLALLQHRPQMSAAEAAAFLPVINHVAAPPAAPQILVKQGVSRCEECNIVFLKVENYEVHKKHYCSARPRSAESGSPGEEGGKAASTPSPTPSQTAPTPPGKILKQYICAHCGIKFSSIVNLKVHQSHYCVKREITQQMTNNNDPPPERKKCSKCKMVLPSEEGGSPHQCAAAVAVSPPVTSLLSSSGWRCPCCSAHLPTATAAQKHLEENHAGMLKGFRCTICSYRGNTLRGMRTHIRMHLLQAGADNKTCAEVKEEDFITCVLQTEPVEREAAAAAAAADEAEAAARLRDEAAHSSPEALVVKLEPCEDKISFTDDADEDSTRHCKACDISFQERDIYLSHKKFYCKAAARRMASVSPSAVKTPPTRPEASART